MDKHSSLFGLIDNDEEIKFYNLDSSSHHFSNLHTSGLTGNGINGNSVLNHQVTLSSNFLLMFMIS